MKKISLTLVTIFALILTTSCSSDDDGGQQNQGTSELKVTIDGAARTFNSIVASHSTEGGDVTDITATINNSTADVISFYAYGTGANQMQNFQYQKDGVLYSSFNNSGSANFVSVVSENTSSRFVATFSGALETYNNDTQEYETITLSGGSITANY